MTTSQFFIPNVADSNGFAPPWAGGTVNSKFWSFAYNTTDVATGATLFTLPYQSIIIGYILNVATAFNGTGDNTFDFGTTGALTQFGADFDASVTGQTMSGFVPSQMYTPLTGDIPFTVIYRGTSASAGKAYITVLYTAISQSLP